jgi:hypothetical protein
MQTSSIHARAPHDHRSKGSLSNPQSHWLKDQCDRKVQVHALMEGTPLRFVDLPGFPFDTQIDAKALPFATSSISNFMAHNGKH